MGLLSELAFSGVTGLSSLVQQGKSDPDPALEREAEEAAQQAMAEGPVIVNRMGTEMHVQRTPSEVSVENNYGTISDLVDQVDKIEHQVNELEDEVHSGLSEKAAAATAAMGGTGLTAGIRAATEDDLSSSIAGSETVMEMLPALAQNSEIAAAAGLGAMLAGGVHVAQQTVDGSGILEKLGGGFKSLKDRVSIFDDNDDGQREDNKKGDQSVTSAIKNKI